MQKLSSQEKAACILDLKDWVYAVRDKHVFIDLERTQNLVEVWRKEYNGRRLHSSLNGKPLNEIAQKDNKRTGTSN